MCILMVEDEALIMEIMAESLADAGYDVLSAADGPAAMKLIAEKPGHFSVLFSDYHLPGGLTGLDIAQELRRQYPTIPVILTTGRPDILDVRWRSDSSFALLRKPYRPSELLSTLGNLVAPHRRVPGR